MYQRILSLDGGGIRGLLSARILQEIENRTGQPIHEMFDLIVGTSTGGILAAGLTRPEKPCSTEELVNLYYDRGHEIFKKSILKNITSLFGWTDEKYDASSLEEILNELLGDSELQSTKSDIILTTYDIEKRQPYLFKTRKAREKYSRNHLLRHAARATSAAPTYFEAFLLDNSKWHFEKYRRVLVDGGVFANNPSMIGLSEALASGSKIDDILLCSIGTGLSDFALPYEKAKNWGMIDWVKPLISVMMDGMADSADYHARMLLPDSGSDQKYFRFNGLLKNSSDDLDNVSRSNILGLLKDADNIIDRQKTELDRLTEYLINSNGIG